jgi:hypothetical protein
VELPFMESSVVTTESGAVDLWTATLRLGSLSQQSPLTSITAGHVLAEPELVQRVLGRGRSRIAVAQSAHSPAVDFLLGELIGAGGMGQVYAATQVSLERTVAVKVLRRELQNDPREVDGFLAEAFVAAELDHPNTVPVYEIGLTDEGLPFYAMKLVRGSKWSSTLRCNTLKENLGVLLMVCDVVAFAHDKGIIHRDLKPENVMVGPYGEVLLMDWGLAASVGNPRAQRLTAGTMCAGTPAYMPPEVASCNIIQIGPASDIYLLGGVLFEILTGLPPHGGEQAMACLVAAGKNELQPTDQDGELMDIARAALRTQPSERYPTVAEFASAIRTALAHIDSYVFFEEGRRRFEGLPGLNRDELYRECHEIVGLYQRALAHWNGNVRAAEGLVRVRETLAAVALRRGEIQLARSQVRAADQDRAQYNLRLLAADGVAEAIRHSLSERDRRGAAAGGEC